MMNYIRLILTCCLISCFVQGIAPEFKTSVVQEIIEDVLHGDFRLLSYRLDVDTKSQLKETLQASIEGLQNQLLSPLQISLLKTICCASAGGFLAAVGGYIYGSLEISPVLSAYMIRLVDHKALEALLKKNEPLPVGFSENAIREDLEKNAYMFSQYKARMLRGIMTFIATAGVYYASYFGINYAASVLQTNEERKNMINNLQAALDELNEANQQ